jgi:hypothetical protein
MKTIPLRLFPTKVDLAIAELVGVVRSTDDIVVGDFVGVFIPGMGEDGVGRLTATPEANEGEGTGSYVEM